MATCILSGDLGALPIGAILQLLQSEVQNGVLVCRHGEAEIRATYREGLIELVEAFGAGAAFRIGRFFVEDGILTAEQIDAVAQAQARAERPAPLGMALATAGLISDEQLRAALMRQSNELLYELVRWPSGRFDFLNEPPGPLAASARLGMSVASAVMEGFRRVDEWRAIEQTLESFESVLVRDAAAFERLDLGALPTKEQAVLAAVDGERTVHEIMAASSLRAFDACRTLAQLLEAGVLRRRD